MPAIDAAFCSAVRLTLVGSMIPASIMSPYSSVAALKPKDAFLVAFPFSTITAPSTPALITI